MHKLLKLIVLLNLSLLMLATLSFAAQHEPHCREMCRHKFNEDGAIQACWQGCGMQFNPRINPNQCDNNCFQQFSNNQNQGVAREQMGACEMGCHH